MQQKKDVDKFSRNMAEIGEWWIKVDVVKGRETDIPKFRVGRKKMEGRWEVGILRSEILTSGEGLVITRRKKHRPQP